MTVSFPARARDAFEDHDAFVPETGGYSIETTVFDSVVTATETNGKLTYTVRLSVPTLDAATADEVADIVVTDWFETFERRLEDAPKATRAAVELADFAVERDGSEVHVEYRFEWGNPDGAADIARTFAEYVQGTYIEGIVPGYEYDPPVSDLLARASQSGKSGTPL